MRRLLLSTVLLFALFVCGCGEPQANMQALDAALVNVRAVALEYQADANAITVAVDAVRKRLSDPNITNETAIKARDVLVELLALHAQIQPKLSAALQAEKTYEAKVAALAADANTTRSQEVVAYGEGAKAVSTFLPPPFNTIVAAIGTLAVGIGGWYAKKKQSDVTVAKQRSDAAAELTGVVASVDKLLQSGLVTDAAAAKKLLAYTQATLAPAAVAAVQRVKDAAIKLAA